MFDEEDFDLAERLRLEDELYEVKRQLNSFWEQEDADEMEDTYGDLVDTKYDLEAKIRELRPSGW